MPLTKQPKRDAAWPPPNAVKPHRVQDGDNWWTLRDRYGLKDVWDLIAFNFQTYDPQEVNWYLGNRVGCKLTTADGKNFRFSSAASPGFIYIPPSAFQPDGAWGTKPTGGDGPAPTTDGKAPDPKAPLSADDQETKKCVLRALDLALATKLDFILPICKYEFLTGSFRMVRTMIAADQIKVRYWPKLKNSAKYRWDDQLLLGFTSTSSVFDQALILHECVHAFMDIEDRSILDKHAEAAAYILQHLYTVHKSEFNRRLPPDFDWLILTHPETGDQIHAKLPGPYIPPLGPVKHNLQIHTLAWWIAMSLYARRDESDPAKRKHVPQDLYLKLLTAVAADPLYKDHANEAAGTDGISPK